jgi:hypothetical protein
MVLKADPNWTGPGPGPMIDVPGPSDGPVYSQVKTEVSRIDNGDGTFTVTYRDSTDPNAPTYTETVGTKTVVKGNGAPDFTNVTNLYNTLGPRVTGAVQTYIDEVNTGVQSGKYSVADAENALKIIGMQADQGMTGAYGAAQGVVAVPPKDDGTGNGNGNGDVPVLYSTASDELKAILERYQLGGLFNALNAAVIADKTLAQNTDALFGSVRNNPIYIERFKGNVARIKNGYVPLSEAQYIAQEQSYSTTLKNSGMPKGFYDTKDDFANLMANDISPAELSNRIENGYKMVSNAPPEVVNQLKMMVPDITDANLAAYFLDPAKSGTKIEQMARAANIAAQGKTAGGMQLTGVQAQSLAQAGITTQQAQAGFSQIGQQAGLYRPLQGEQDITQEDILAGTFTNEQAAQQRIARRKRGRTAAFESGGSFAQSQQSNIGLTTVGQ